MATGLDLVQQVLDPGSWRSWDSPLPTVGDSYAAELTAARQATGLDEAVVTGAGSIDGRRVAVIVSDFGFLAGSIGVAAAERVVLAVERATREGLPLVSSPASGGTRLQEGTVAFVQMVKIAAALAAHRAAGLPYLVYLRHPTTGGVLASWGSLGHVTAAEPGALIGLVGPRVQEAVYGHALPAHVQTSENLYDHGVIDAVVPPAGLRTVAARVLNVLAAAGERREGSAATVSTPQRPAADLTDGGGASTWSSVVRSRRPDRPGVRALLRVAATDVTPLSGTGAGERDGGLVLALARFGRAPCVVLGQGRRRGARSTIGPAGLREALRGMQLAKELRLPLVTVVDTPGLMLTAADEEGGLAGGIARCLAELVTLPSPTACVLLGEGGGGVALALLPADRVICAEHAWLSPLPPEGVSEVLHHAVDRAPDVADELGIGSKDLLRAGVVDRIVPEPRDPAVEPDPFLRQLGMILEDELLELVVQGPTERLARRLARYRRLGSTPGGTPNGLR